MLKRKLMHPIAALAALAMTGTALADGAVITGQISYRERIALPDNAVAEVQLVDVSRADAPAITLASQTIDPAGQVPISFALDFDPTEIASGHSYAIEARISVADELWFINDTRYSIDPLTYTGSIDMLLVRAGGTEAASDAGLAGTSWRLVSLSGQDTPDDIETTFAVNAEGGINGKGGCNGYGGTVTYEGENGIAFSEVFSTMMYCEPSMAQERAFFDALDASQSYAIDGETLTLLDADGVALATLIATQAD